MVVFRYPAEERRVRRLLLHHRFIGESVISGADSLYDIALSEVGSFEELPGIHYVIPPGFESVIDILRDNIPPSCLLLEHTVTNISWNNVDLSESFLHCYNAYVLSRRKVDLIFFSTFRGLNFTARQHIS